MTNVTCYFLLLDGHFAFRTFCPIICHTMVDTGGHFVKVKEAAEILGVSERTIRRRIKSGQLESEKRGQFVYVNVRTQVDTDGQSVHALKDEIDHLKTLLDEVRGERDYLRQLVAVVYTEQKRLESGSPWWKFWEKD